MSQGPFPGLHCGRAGAKMALFFLSPLVECLRKVASPEADIVTLPWAYETEDYNIAIMVPDTMKQADLREIQARLVDAVIDWDEAHDSFTVCMVWRQGDKELAGAGNTI